METLLGTKPALLQALRHAPGYGAGLVRWVRERSSGRVRLGHGNVYPALKALEHQGLVRSWKLVPGRRRGSRSRTYYELTPKGVAAADEQRRAIADLLAPPVPHHRVEDPSIMRGRLRSCADVSWFVLGLRDRMREPVI